MSEEVVLSTTDELPPAEIWLTPDRPDILTGELVLYISSLPSCPLRLLPKLLTVPSLCNNNVWLKPQAACTTSLKPEIVVGVFLFSLSPCPVPPSHPSPQVLTVLSLRTATV